MSLYKTNSLFLRNSLYNFTSLYKGSSLYGSGAAAPPSYSDILSWTLNSTLGFDDTDSLDRTENSNDAKLVESFCADFDVGDYIEFTDLTGVHILGYLGSAILVIDGNTIKATTAGTAFALELSDGTFLPLQGSAYDISGNGNHGTISGVEYINNSSGSTFQTWAISNN